MDRTFVVSLALSDRLGKDTFQAYSVSAPNVASASDTAVQRAKGLGLSLREVVSVRPHKGKGARGGGGANLLPAMPGGHGSFGTLPTVEDVEVIFGGGGAKGATRATSGARGGGGSKAPALVTTGVLGDREVRLDRQPQGLEDALLYGVRCASDWDQVVVRRGDEKVAAIGQRGVAWVSPSERRGGGGAAVSPQVKRKVAPRRAPYADLPILPSVVADTVSSQPYTGDELSGRVRSTRDVERTEALREHMSPRARREFADLVDARCRAAYETGAEWFEEVVEARGNAGRDQLYAWVSHWLASYLKDPKRFRGDEERRARTSARRS